MKLKVKVAIVMNAEESRIIHDMAVAGHREMHDSHEKEIASNILAEHGNLVRQSHVIFENIREAR